MDVIEEMFKSKAIIRGGTWLFNPSVALEIIKKCSQVNRKILGIDAFLITEKRTQPVLEHSIDYSMEDSIDGNWNHATNFIQERMNEGFMFEIVYD